MSPMKILQEKTVKEYPSTPPFLDMHFSDEEEDDDFCPHKSSRGMFCRVLLIPKMHYV